MTCRLCNDLCLPGCLAVSWPKYDLSRHASNLNTSTSQAQSGQHNQTWIGDACKLRLQHASALKNRRKRTISRTDHCIVCRCCRKKDTQQLKLSFWLSSVDTGRDCCQQSIRLNVCKLSTVLIFQLINVFFLKDPAFLALDWISRKQR